MQKNRRKAPGLEEGIWKKLADLKNEHVYLAAVHVAKSSKENTENKLQGRNEHFVGVISAFQYYDRNSSFKFAWKPKTYEGSAMWSATC